MLTDKIIPVTLMVLMVCPRKIPYSLITQLSSTVPTVVQIILLLKITSVPILPQLMPVLTASLQGVLFPSELAVLLSNLHYKGNNDGADLTNVYTINTTISKQNSHAGVDAADCTLEGVIALTNLDQPYYYYPYGTRFAVTYRRDHTYTSLAVYSESPYCYVEWTGRYTYGPRSYSFPEDLAYSYTTHSIMTHAANASSLCSGVYTRDPAACEGFPSGSADESSCFILWDQVGPSCSSYKLADSNGNLGPTWNLKFRGDDDELASPSVSGASSILIGLTMLILQVILLL